MSRLTISVCCAIIAVLFAMTGCPKKGNTSMQTNQESDDATSSVKMADDSRPQTTSTQTGAFNEALKLWSADQKDESVQTLLGLNWDDQTIFDNEPALTLSESEFVKLPASERQAIQTKAIKISKHIRMIAKHMVELANQRIADNQTDRAELYKQTLEKLSNTLKASDKLKLMQTVGDAVGKYANEHIVLNKTD